MSKEKEIKEILEGKMSAQRSRELLNGIDSKDMEHFLESEDNKHLFEMYKKNHPTGIKKVNQLPEAHMDDMWGNILEKSRTQQKQTNQNKGKAFVGMLSIIKRPFFNHPMVSAALAFSLVLMVTLTVYQKDKDGVIVNYKGNKGGTAATASLEYAILGQTGKLDRPDRALTEADTLAFRLSVKHSGYYSIGVCHGQTCDWIISNRVLDKGIHDLKEGYVLTGNQGNNTLILVSSEKAVQLKAHENYLLDKSGTREPVRMTLEDSKVSVSFQHFEVRASEKTN